MPIYVLMHVIYKQAFSIYTHVVMHLYIYYVCTYTVRQTFHQLYIRPLLVGMEYIHSLRILIDISKYSVTENIGWINHW